MIYIYIYMCVCVCVLFAVRMVCVLFVAMLRRWGMFNTNKQVLVEKIYCLQYVCFQRKNQKKQRIDSYSVVQQRKEVYSYSTLSTTVVTCVWVCRQQSVCHVAGVHDKNSTTQCMISTVGVLRREFICLFEKSKSIHFYSTVWPILLCEMLGCDACLKRLSSKNSTVEYYRGRSSFQRDLLYLWYSSCASCMLSWVSRRKEVLTRNTRVCLVSVTHV